MKTPEQKLKFVMEAVGECVHVWKIPEDFSAVGACEKCGLRCEDTRTFDANQNPSPTDMNRLMELAEKLGCPDIVSGQTTDGDYFADLINSDAEVMLGNSRGEALLNALYSAAGGKDELF